MSKVLVVLSGCGFLDGSEIHEAVLSLRALSQHQQAYTCAALDAPQACVVDHRTKESCSEQRNGFTEAARLARGEIQSLQNCLAQDYTGLLIPGGFGVAQNLCDFAQKGLEMQVHPLVTGLLQDFYAQQKPIAALCIAPVLLAKVLGSKGFQATLGATSEASQCLEAWGIQHVECPPGEFVEDTQHRIFSTPAYMHDGSSIHEVATGIEKLVASFLEATL